MMLKGSLSSQIYLYKRKDGKSIKWSWFHANAIELIRLKNPVRWNLNKLFEEVID